MQFPASSQAMSLRVRGHDWASTPLGAIETWPVALRVAVNMVMDSRFPQCLVWGPELTAIYNDAFVPILGEKVDALGRSFRDIWSEAWDQIGPISAKAFAGEATFIEDYPLTVNRYGFAEDAFFTFCYSPVHDENGHVVGMLDTVMETTGKALAERELRQLASSLERQVAERTADRNRLWQLSGDVMLVARFDGVVVAVNPAWERMLGWAQRELIGRNVYDLIHPDDQLRTRAAARSLAEGEHLSRFDNRYRHRDGPYHWISWTAVPGDGFINAVGRDFTAEREQAEALQRTEELLRQSQKMEAVGQLTGGLAHDFNNLLVGITGSLELLKMRLDQGRVEDTGRYIAAAHGAAQRAAGLTHRLLAFSRRQTLTPQTTQVNGLIASLEDLVQRTVGPNIEFVIDAQADLWPALIDPHQLESALLNLCINARDAMPEGGRLSILTRNAWLSDQEAAALELMPGPYLALEVNDTGTGMSAETIARAFDPFFTTKPTGQGTGLGLSMVYGFARQSGGQVRIQSSLGAGASVRLYLPRCEAEGVVESVTADSCDVQQTGHGETVLVIDDEPTLRMLIGEVLDELGYRALSAADGAEGLAILQSDERVDLLITDVGLPGGMNGRQVADAARALRPGLAVLFITGYAEVMVSGNTSLEPGMQVLTKPFAIEVLADRVKTLLASTGSAPV